MPTDTGYEELGRDFCEDSQPPLPETVSDDPPEISLPTQIMFGKWPDPEQVRQFIECRTGQLEKNRERLTEPQARDIEETIESLRVDLEAVERKLQEKKSPKKPAQEKDTDQAALLRKLSRILNEHKQQAVKRDGKKKRVEGVLKELEMVRAELSASEAKLLELDAKAAEVRSQIDILGNKTVPEAAADDAKQAESPQQPCPEEYMAEGKRLVEQLAATQRAAEAAAQQLQIGELQYAQVTATAAIGHEALQAIASQNPDMAQVVNKAWNDAQAKQNAANIAAMAAQACNISPQQIQERQESAEKLAKDAEEHRKKKSPEKDDEDSDLEDDWKTKFDAA